MKKTLWIDTHRTVSTGEVKITCQYREDNMWTYWFTNSSGWCVCRMSYVKPTHSVFLKWKKHALNELRRYRK
jgi:hypothetical protein